MDTGIGIAPEDAELVMQEWCHIETAVVSKQKGSSLDLSLSRKFAELLGGRLWFESKPGIGSTFFLSIPSSAYAEKVAEEKALPRQLSPSDAQYILIADDDEVARYLLQRRLSTLTVAPIVEVADGKACLEAIRTYALQIVFLDLKMPLLSETEVVRHLRASVETAELPVIVFTSNTLTPDKKDFLRL